jgi:hypothetical protein
VPKDVKEVLYSVIDAIGREKIRADVSRDAGTSKRYCEEIVQRCIFAFGDEANDEILGTLCEALLHFMLTASQLPSERKVTVDGTELDVVVPNVKSLAKTPDKALVIQVLKTADRAKIKQAEALQRHRENIWIISAKKIDYNVKNYALEGAEFKYSSIISDIRAFLSRKGVSSLKMLHG